MRTFFALLPLFFLLAACGGAGGGSDSGLTDEPAVYAREVFILDEARIEHDHRAVMAQITTPAEPPQQYYFAGDDDDAAHAEKPVSGGYYRVLYGYTAAGHHVLQDFYQDSGARQTTAFIVRDAAKLRDFTASPDDGTVIWFDPEGKVRQRAAFRHGELSGMLEYFYPNGQLRARAPATTEISGNGQVDNWQEDGTRSWETIIAAHRPVQGIQRRADGSVHIKIHYRNSIPHQAVIFDRHGKRIKVLQGEALNHSGLLE